MLEVKESFYLLLAKKLRILGDKSFWQNFSRPYRRIRPAKLANHSVRTERYNKYFRTSYKQLTCEFALKGLFLIELNGYFLSVHKVKRGTVVCIRIKLPIKPELVFAGFCCMK